MKGAESVGPPCVASVLKPHPQVVCSTPPRIYLSQHVGLYFACSLAKAEKFGYQNASGLLADDRMCDFEPSVQVRMLLFMFMSMCNVSDLLG